MLTQKIDNHYRHIVVWDLERLEIAGAYRLGEGKRILQDKGEHGFYTRSLYQFKPEFYGMLCESVELGRSFVNPAYWGKASLDYLWQGIGAYLAHNPSVRYVIGPVSMSANYPRALMDTLVYFYQRYYANPKTLVQAYNPYELSEHVTQQLDNDFADKTREEAFDFMQKRFIELGCKLPVLFKQYAGLYAEGGFSSLVFSVDPDFGDC